MKKILEITLITILIFIAYWLLFSFVIWEINPEKWHNEVRVLFVTLSLFSIATYVLFKKLKP